MSVKLLGAVTVAVFVKALAADDGSTVPVTVKTIWPPVGTVTSGLIVFEPCVAPLAPPE